MTNEILLLIHLVCVIASVIVMKFFGKDGLGSLFAILLLISNLFCVKEVAILGLTIPVCDVYTIGSILCLNLIQEIYGKNQSRRYLYRGIVLLCIFLLMSMLQNTYIATEHSKEMGLAFKKILTHTPRIVLASLTATFLSDRIDMFIFQRVRKKYPTFPFVMRFLSSTLFSQLIDTFLFCFLGIYGIVENIWHCIWVTYFVKISFILGFASYFFFTKRSFYKPVNG